MNIIEQLAKEFELRLPQAGKHSSAHSVRGRRSPLSQGIERKCSRRPFRRVHCADLGEWQRLTYLRNLEERKEEVIRLIEEQGKTDR